MALDFLVKAGFHLAASQSPALKKYSFEFTVLTLKLKVSHL